MERMEDNALRDRLAAVLEKQTPSYLFPLEHADLILAALGLDDLDAAVERVQRALVAMPPSYPESDTERAKVAVAALLATEGRNG